jgi:pSer/pThr/pTyr-binding forkhead associated (FHA) protein
LARLSIINNGQFVRSVELGASEMVIGRGEDVSIQLRHPLISRRHARVYLTPAGYIVEDQGTKNGTFVKSRRIQRHRLVDGDELEIADFILQYHAEGFVPIDDDVPAEAAPGGLVAKDRKKSGKSPLEAYMEALKRGGSNATAAIPPEAMARLREQARKKATPRVKIDDLEPLSLDERVTTLGWGNVCTIRLSGRWLWIKEAARITRDDGAIKLERLHWLVRVKVNGKKIKGEHKLEFGDRIQIGKRVVVLMEGEAAF